MIHSLYQAWTPGRSVAVTGPTSEEPFVGLSAIVVVSPICVQDVPKFEET